MKNFDTEHLAYSGQYSQEYGLEAVFTAQISRYEQQDPVIQAEHALSNSDTYQDYTRAKTLLTLYWSKP